MLSVGAFISSAAEFGAQISRPQALRFINPDQQQKSPSQTPPNADGTSSLVTSARKEGERLDLSPATQQAPASDTILGVSTYNSFGRSSLIGSVAGEVMNVFA